LCQKTFLRIFLEKLCNLPWGPIVRWFIGGILILFSSVFKPLFRVDFQILMLIMSSAHTAAAVLTSSHRHSVTPNLEPIAKNTDPCDSVEKQLLTPLKLLFNVV
jgi:hypothetical protein